MVRVKLPRLKCLRCGHEWVPQQEEVNMCPKCKTKSWDKLIDILAPHPTLSQTIFCSLVLPPFSYTVYTLVPNPICTLS